MSTSGEENVCTSYDGTVSASGEYIAPKPRGVGPKSGAATSVPSQEGSRHDGRTLQMGCLPSMGQSPPAESSTTSPSSKSLRVDTRPLPRTTKPRAIGVRRQPPRRSKSGDAGSATGRPSTSSPTFFSPAVTVKAGTTSRLAKQNVTPGTIDPRTTGGRIARSKSTMPSKGRQEEGRGRGRRGNPRKPFRKRRELATSPPVSYSGNSSARRPRTRKANGVSVFSPHEVAGREFELEAADDDAIGEAGRTLKGAAPVELEEESGVYAERPEIRTVRSSGPPRRALTPCSVRTPRSTDEETTRIKRRRVVSDFGMGVRRTIYPSKFNSLPPTGARERFEAKGASILACADSDDEAEATSGWAHETGCWQLSDGEETDVDESCPRSPTGNSRAPRSSDTRDRSGRKGKLRSPRRKQASAVTPRGQGSGTSISIRVSQEGKENRNIANESAGRKSVSPTSSSPLAMSSAKLTSASVRSDGMMIPSVKDQKALEALKAHFSKVDSHELQLSRY